jgi:hypothetical protein
LSDQPLDGLSHRDGLILGQTELSSYGPWLFRPVPGSGDMLQNGLFQIQVFHRVASCAETYVSLSRLTGQAGKPDLRLPFQAGVRLESLTFGCLSRLTGQAGKPDLRLPFQADVRLESLTYEWRDFLEAGSPRRP